MVVVTGASGHIGANLVRHLLARGEQVRAVVHREAASLDGLDIERVSGDITVPASLKAAFEGADVGIHLAALISITGSQSGAVERMNVVARATQPARRGKRGFVGTFTSPACTPGTTRPIWSSQRTVREPIRPTPRTISPRPRGRSR